MAKQARAVQTWRSIVDAAASVFDDYGYERAAISEILRRAKVTKGALYFHFASKEAIAQAIMDEQTSTVEFEQEGSPLQSLVDGGQQFAFALRHNSMARAGTRLSIEGVFLGGPHPWGDWIDATARMLELGQERGEVFPQIDPMVSAKIIVASFTGIQLVSEADSGRADLREQVAEMWRHILPSIAHPGVIAHIKPEGRVDLAAQAREKAEREEQEARIAAEAKGAGSDPDLGSRPGGAGLRGGGSGRGPRVGGAGDEGDEEPAGAGVAAGGVVA
ncbi:MULTISPECIES: ScbR family autoregulator-binding transcription factor [Streptomyces]|uniref:ScbR family autoregulator-binding transcription factor n=1 Tax=Streptomyces TaxID=1883 RepID=UPI000304D3C0|nr:MULTISPECIES: ScbR family autoregulator-binding transcription factor [Streptomyces]MCX4486000.1 ScbR family autoregulator-binding transcription factor [Streptomyces anulatus]MCX4519696.1 ScbR family autoregulator-binding transcription factor [Streptomyces anulatus]MCX4602578.1 ScbR family autoregulator-binding transcription factor [Streptomyces anulatus]WSI78896.1 TetR/AcrR family transcriptional regulator [Streptomyces anulatus]WSU74889.1 TetR/AcrR family transcriptional regulator [Strepto